MSLSKLERQTLIMYAVFYCVYVLFTSFLNVYLFEYTKSFVVMSLFVVFRQLAFLMTYLLTNKLIKKRPLSVIMIYGSIGLIISLVLSLLCTNLFAISGYYCLPIAFISGAGFVLTWFVANSLIQIVPSNESRSNFIMIKASVEKISSIVSPLVSTVILSFSSSDIVGYRYILIFLLVLCLIVCILTSKIKIDERPECNYTFLDSIRFVEETRKEIYLINLFYGFFDGLFIATTGILLNNASSSGTLYSSLLTVFAIIGVIACRYVKKLFKKNVIQIALIITGLLSLSMTCILAIHTNMFGAVYFGFMNATANNFFANIYNFILGQVGYKYNKQAYELLSGKNFYNSAGRIMGMLIIVASYFILPETISLKVSVCVSSMFVIVAIKYLLSLSKKIF